MSALARILVIDDDPPMLRVYVRFLKHLGEVVCSADGVAALPLLFGEPPFDVVLCDVDLPRLSGLELYQQVHAVRPELAARFIFVTGFSSDPRIADLGRPTLLKPFSPAALLELIARTASIPPPGQPSE